MNLSPVQKAHLQNVSVADRAWREAKTSARLRARFLADEEVASYLAARDHEVRLAFEAGVPKIRLRLEGLGTSSPETLDGSLARTEAAHRTLVGKLTDIGGLPHNLEGAA